MQREKKYEKIKFSELNNFSTYDEVSLLKIKPPIFTSHSFIYIFLFLCVLCAILFGQASIYIFPLLFLLIFIFYRLWVLSEPAKVIYINKKDKYFIIIPRNPFQLVLLGETKINFAEINTFLVSEGPEIIHETSTRYIISAHLKDSSMISFTQTTKETISENGIKFFNAIIKANKRY